MKYISLFSGIGGLDLGLDRAGMECVAQVEIDPFCRKVLTKHWPNVPKFEDVRNVGKYNLPAADVIAGGFPCQPHSYAGKRKGKSDDRNLWPEYLRIVTELRPRFVIGENVPGIVTTMLDEVLSDLEHVGYACQAFIIPASAFDAPHKRERVWVIAKNSEQDGCRLGANENPIGFGEQRNTGPRNENGLCSQSPADPNGARFSRAVLGQLASIYSQVESSARGEFGGIFSAGERWQESWFDVATRLCRVDDGIPGRVDRLRSLGNAVVPQCAEYIGRILQAKA